MTWKVEYFNPCVGVNDWCIEYTPCTAEKPGPYFDNLADALNRIRLEREMDQENAREWGNRYLYSWRVTNTETGQCIVF